MRLGFTSPSKHPPGTVFRLLREAWSPLWNPALSENIRRFDAEVHGRPEAVGACTFITCLGGSPIGMASFDPRQHPGRGIIGWNCIVPAFQRRGFGGQQILEILRIFRGQGFHRAWVATADEDFFVPAQRTYEACGFVRVSRTGDNNIEYELDLGTMLQPGSGANAVQARRLAPWSPGGSGGRVNERGR